MLVFTLFLGDAILGMAVARKIKATIPYLSPIDYSNLSREIECNRFLACVVCNLALTDYMITGIGYSKDNIDSWHAEFSIALADSNQKLSANLPPSKNDDGILLFWNYMKAAPKTIADFCEALIGAIFVDSGFDFLVVENVLENFLFKPWWNRFEKLWTRDGFQGHRYTIEKRLKSFHCSQLHRE